MPLSVGDRLGPYQILAPIGAGGMGEVYRAKDTKLKRDVALKVLPSAFANDPERMARFQREAEVLAALNHPNIAAIYGIEQQALVMEFVEGENLKCPLPTAMALNYARQIAEALEAAHEKGIVHRDLKPPNVKVTPAGVVKVLDFGLAKAMEQPADSDGSSISSTLTFPLSIPEVIMGTPAYMSPEQAQGSGTDRRADIWSFGAVLYEMLTGKRAFAGKSVSDTLVSVLKEEPDWSALPEETPAPVRELLRRCLTKDRKRRLQAIGDARIAIEEVSIGVSQESGTPVAASRSRWPWAAAAAMLVVAVAAGAAWFLRPKPEQPLLQVEITPPEGAKFVSTISYFSHLALSPDGRRIAFLATGKDGKQMLWLRSIDSSAAVALAGTENADGPFWSPDSRWVGFSASSQLQKVDVVTGGQPQVICDIEGRTAGTWNAEGVIVFGQGGKPLQRVSAAGGTPAPILSFDAAREETYQGAPYFLPDGRHLMYFSNGRKGGHTMLASLDRQLNRILIEDGDVAIYAPNPRGGGSILYNPRGQLLARPFDLDKLEFTGPPAVIADAAVGGGRWWSASADGLIAFRRFYSAQNQLTWVSRDGHSMSTLGDPGELLAPRISPDQKTLAFTRLSGQNDDVWMLDLARNTTTRFTFESDNIAPIWSSDGKSIVYASDRNGVMVLVERPVNGIGSETTLASREYMDRPTAVSRDGRWLVLSERTPARSIIALRSREDPNKVVRIQERGLELDGSISPDGRWLLYSSLPATLREVLVRSVPKEAGGSPSAVGKWQISTAGGSQPVWRADGKEIFYVGPDGIMMAAPVESGENFFRPGAPKPLFQTRLNLDAAIRQYDVTADGQRFLLNQRLPDDPDAPITVVVNWPKLLEK
jgi:Tol biopolymer transport system component/predicted Ser/Thr protein kinase